MCQCKLPLQVDQTVGAGQKDVERATNHPRDFVEDAVAIVCLFTGFNGLWWGILLGLACSAYAIGVLVVMEQD